MRESSIRDRAAEDQSAEGSVDKSVVNWLMHVISGKAPIELGINDAPEEAEKTLEARPQIVSPREEVKQAAAPPPIPRVPTAPPVSKATFSVEDLCGAPLYPVVNEVKTAHHEVSADDLCFVPEGGATAPEQSGTSQVKRMSGLQLVEMSKPANAVVDSQEAHKSEFSELLREELRYGPPPTETTSAIAESLRARRSPTGVAPGEIDPLDLTRDPDYYEEKVRERKVAESKVDWVPPSAESETVHASSGAAAGGQFAVVSDVAEPEIVDFIPAYEPEAVETVYQAPAPVVVDPFAGVEFSARPAVQEPEPVAVEAVPEVVETAPESVSAPEPIAQVIEAVPIHAAEPEAQVVEAVPELEPLAQAVETMTVPVVESEPEVIEAVPEPEAVQAVHVTPAEAAVPDPFAGIDFSAEPEVREAEPVAPVSEPVAEPVAVSAVEEPEVVSESREPEVVHASHEAIEAEAVPVTEMAAAAEVVRNEPEVAQASETPVAAIPEVVQAESEPKTAEQEVVVEPEVVEPVESQAEQIVEAAAVVEPEVGIPAEVQPAEPVAAPEMPEVAAHVEDVPAATDEKVFEAAPKLEAEAASVLPWTVAAAQRDPRDKTFSAQDFYQLQTGVQKPVREVAEAKPVIEAQPKPAAEVEGKPEDLTAALKTLMQLGSVLPLAARMAPMMEAEQQGGEAAAGERQEVKQEVSGLRLLQYEIKTTVQDHSMHLKRLEDQLTQMQESAEMDSAESASVLDNVKSTVKMVRVMGIGLGVMLLVLILMIGMFLVRAK